MTATERRYEELRAVAAARRAIKEASRRARRRAWWLSGIWMGVVLGWVLCLAWVLGLAAGR
jgi:fatty acid desaturase